MERSKKNIYEEEFINCIMNKFLKISSPKVKTDCYFQTKHKCWLFKGIASQIDEVLQIAILNELESLFKNIFLNEFFDFINQKKVVTML